MTHFGPARPGAQGAAGRDAGINYKFNTATSGDPGSGKLLLNNATLALATALHLSETDDDGASIAALLATWDDGTSTIRGRLLIRKVGTPATFAEYAISGTLTDNGTYDVFTIAHVASNGTFSSADEVMLTFVPKGDKGDTGAAGSNGSNGSNGSPGADGRDAGWRYTFSTLTSGTPSSGALRFNNATLASVTEIVCADTDADGNFLPSVFTTWHLANCEHQGFLTIRKVGDPDTFIDFRFSAGTTGSFTSGLQIASGGTFSNGDAVVVSFRPFVQIDIPTVGIYCRGDGDTGIYSPSANQLAVSCGGSDAAIFPKHRAEIVRAAAQSLTNTSFVQIDFDTSNPNFSPVGITFDGSQTNELLIARSGFYHYEISYGINGVTGSLAALLIVGAGVGSQKNSNAAEVVCERSGTIWLASGNRVGMQVQQITGATRNTETSTALRPRLSLVEA